MCSSCKTGGGSTKMATRGWGGQSATKALRPQTGGDVEPGSKTIKGQRGGRRGVCFGGTLQRRAGNAGGGGGHRHVLLPVRVGTDLGRIVGRALVNLRKGSQGTETDFKTPLFPTRRVIKRPIFSDSNGAVFRPLRLHSVLKICRWP